MMLVDGQPATLVSAADRGLHYADGLFETMRLHAGAIPLLERHLARLAEGCRQIGLPHPGDETLRADLERLLAGAPAAGVLRLVLTRGDGPRGYAPPPGARGRRMLALHPLPPALPAKLTVGICQTRLGTSPALAGLKHLGRLEQVLAAREVAEAGWHEGLMLDADGRVIEGTRHNVFFVRDGRLVTPPLGHCGVAGLLRMLTLEALERLGLPCDEAPLQYHELDEIEELLLCNAVAGLRAAGRLAGRLLGEARILARLRPALVEAGVTWLA